MRHSYQLARYVIIQWLPRYKKWLMTNYDTQKKYFLNAADMKFVLRFQDPFAADAIPRGRLFQMLRREGILVASYSFQTPPWDEAYLKSIMLKRGIRLRNLVFMNVKDRIYSAASVVGRGKYCAKFMREGGQCGNGAVLKGLEHPCLPKYFQVFRNRKLHIQVMEWVPGLRMNLWLKYARPGRSKNKDRLLRLGRQVTDVVSYLHRKGIIHGDLTPGNLLVHRNRIRLVDMESARKVGAHRIGRMRLSAKPSPLSAELKKVGEVLKTLTGADHPK